MPQHRKVLLVGATGQVGRLVADELLKQGKEVHALVRPHSNADALISKGVSITRGDMMDPASLVKAMSGMDAVVTTAAGYTQHSKGDTVDIDTIGNRNLAEAAKKTGIKRFVLTSILTADQAPQIPHFWHKKLAEDYLEQAGVPFVALRPGAFVDAWVMGKGLPNKPLRIAGTGSKSLPVCFVLNSQIAYYLAAAVDAQVTDGERIDIGWDKPYSAAELQQAAEKVLQKSVSLWVVPPFLVNTVGVLLGSFSRMIHDMTAMIQWFNTSKFINQPQRQREVFGPLPTAEESLRKLLTDRGYQTY